MNIFVLDLNPRAAAEYQCDKHVVKMCLESTQILSTVCHKYTGDAPYRKTHANHPCTLWAGESFGNFSWLVLHTNYLFEEYTKRYKRNHKSEAPYYAICNIMKDVKFPKEEMTPFAQAMPEKYRDPDAVKAYRNYYIGEKAYMAAWSKTPIPYWFANKEVSNRINKWSEDTINEFKDNLL